MNKKKLIIEFVLFVLLLIGITIIYNIFMSDNTQLYTPENIIENVENKEEAPIIEIKDSKHFEQEVINESRMVFIDFYANWCMPCKTMSPIIEDLAKEYKDVKFVKIDIDKNEELAIKYNVMSIPTMIIMKNGDVIKTFLGVTNKQTIVKEFLLD